jgi:hypothetical protein
VIFVLFIFISLTSCESRFVNNWAYITEKKNGRIFNTMENRIMICLDSSYFKSQVNFEKVKKVRYLNGSFKLKYEIKDSGNYNVCVKYEDVYFRSGEKMRTKTYKKLAPDMNQKGLEKIKPLLNSDWKIK